MTGTDAGTAVERRGARGGLATATTALGLLLGAGYLAAGVAGWAADATGGGGELVAWIVLTGLGGAVVLVGVALVRTRPWIAVAAFALGGVAGAVALFWSIAAPLLTIALVACGTALARREAP